MFSSINYDSDKLIKEAEEWIKKNPDNKKENEELMSKLKEMKLANHNNNSYSASNNSVNQTLKKNYEKYQSTINLKQKQSHQKLYTEYKQLIDALQGFKTLGNTKFGRGQYYESTSYYITAINLYNYNLENNKNTEIKDKLTQNNSELNNLLSVLATNASLSFMNAHEVDLSLKYAELAIKFDSNNPKGYYRKSICFQKMSKHSAALEFMEIAIEKCGLPKDQSLKSSFQRECESQRVKLKKLKTEEKNTLERISNDDQFSRFPVTMVWKEGMGRCIMAAEDLPKGTMVLRVAPYGSILVDLKVKTHCGSCLCPLAPNVKFHQCGGCNNNNLCEKCFNDPVVKEQHDWECDIFKFLQINFSQSVARDFKCMIRVLLRGIYEMKNKTKPKCPEFWNKKPYICDSYQDLLNLSHSMEQVPKDQMESFQSSANALFQVFQYVKGDNYLSSFIKKEDILHLHSVVLSNGHEAIDPFTQETFGIGIYPTASYLNHSCTPNCDWYVDEDGMFVFRNKRLVKKGEELTITYMDIAAYSKIRRTLLLDQYFFYCKCERCVKDEQTTGYLCQNPDCREPLTPDQMIVIEPSMDNKDAPHDGRLLVCSKGHINTVTQFSEYMKSLETMDVSGLEKWLEGKNPPIFNVVVRNYPSIYFLFEDICKAAEEDGDIEKCIEMRRKSIEIMKSIYTDFPNVSTSEEVIPYTICRTYIKLFDNLKSSRKNNNSNKKKKLEIENEMKEIRTKVLELFETTIGLSTNHLKLYIEQQLTI
eukprot:gene8340-10244_t